MKLVVNGKPLEAEGQITVAGLLRMLELHDRPVAVEVNLEIVPRKDHDRHVLAEGDRLEVVSLTGGG